MKIKKLFLALLVVIIVSLAGMSAQCLGPSGISGSFNIKLDEEEPQEESSSEEEADEEEPQEESSSEEEADEEEPQEESSSEEEADSEEDEDFEFEISTATEEIYQPIVVYDFYEEAPYARWEHASHVIDWDEDWYAGQAWVSCVGSSWFEDGTKYFRVLNTVTGEDECQLTGIFPNLSENITIPTEARFKAKVGFLVTSTTASMAFRIRFYDGSNWYSFPSGSGIQCENDGVLDILDIDLSSIAGKSGKIYLDVAPDDCSRECRVAWINPRIVK